ncbi:hypothetical protein [Paenibacillus pini]|uniref:Methyltransferase type 11 n=1 Tax=Paenibacillus pini JCM 16418 TaxID=1236976 RepID=W7YT70_9BACL|nr:hypothetical protein [Paenibacillus pini]GAF07826.1 methyltransferase type 11 [Paenibacillus pini JCM 16418]
MFTLSDFQDEIEQQIFHNRNKSFFYETNGHLVLTPSDETMEMLRKRAPELSDFIKSVKLDGTYKQLIKDVSVKTVKSFIEANQYLNFSQDDQKKLHEMYRDLFDQVYDIANQLEISTEELELLFAAHYQNLQSYLVKSNGTAIFEKYKERSDLLDIKCAEYTPEFQMSLLELDFDTIVQPVLDIGCGSQASMVHFLRENEIDACGMDRNVNDTDFLIQVNWLDYTFTPDTWGTIVSHMAFSNHFMHHHMKEDGNFENYALKYMEILKALKVGGAFIYSPGLNFIEEPLSNNHAYDVETNELFTKVIRIR